MEAAARAAPSPQRRHPGINAGDRNTRARAIDSAAAAVSVERKCIELAGFAEGVPRDDADGNGGGEDMADGA